ncbi:nuclear transport factor 2 family protein [Kineococcus sp. T13]|uniref:nuclear transport factor 2 family protein n=1 Tax=Kineococcus vitellinus TaxID=2696565 RepID=UPI001412EEAA|nr:nuclear transport factor 2 family protein [Kineococcus vitellinus]NAZ75484.1 nuclear transport factor 2 family protein [Kineococcus vitellinus]
MDTDDRWAITETLSRVGHVFDDGRLDEIDTVFTADVVYDMSAVGMPVIDGIGAARELAQQLGDHGPIAHYVSNVVVTGQDGDQVTVDSKGLMLMADRTLNGVVHHDVLRRESTGWRIARRLVVPQGTEVPA